MQCHHLLVPPGIANIAAQVEPVGSVPSPHGMNGDAEVVGPFATDVKRVSTHCQRIYGGWTTVADRLPVGAIPTREISGRHAARIRESPAYVKGVRAGGKSQH